eukprot:g48861.t1
MTRSHFSHTPTKIWVSPANRVYPLDMSSRIMLKRFGAKHILNVLGPFYNFDQNGAPPRVGGGKVELLALNQAGPSGPGRPKAPAGPVAPMAGEDLPDSPMARLSKKSKKRLARQEFRRQKLLQNKAVVVT